jgi:hypothetical protein
MLDPRWTLKWALRTLQANPTAWCVAAGAWALVPLLDGARTVGLAASDTDLASLAADCAWLSALAGATLGLSAAQSGRFLLGRAGHRVRTLAEFVLIATSALALGVACALGALWVDPEAGLAAGVRALASAFHLGACGLLVLRIPGAPVLRSVFLVTGVMVLPALLQGGAPAVDVLHGVLDPTASGGPGAILAAGCALILAALLIPAPRSSAT